MLLFVIYCNREPVPVLSSFNAKMQIWNVFGWVGIVLLGKCSWLAVLVHP